jgi:hypothetical protein
MVGAFDLGLAADGSLDFYERDSAGQWHWLEAETGLPMTAAPADLLELTRPQPPARRRSGNAGASLSGCTPMDETFAQAVPDGGLQGADVVLDPSRRLPKISRLRQPACRAQTVPASSSHTIAGT